MATIYRARDAQLERDVAVKILRPEYGADPDFNERFRHEAQSAASLNHPSVVAVYDYGTDPVGPFIVMELVEGEDLATIIRRSGALPPRAAARLVAQAARALAAAHARGFVHRDIKPGNILVTHEGRVKVADFGIARALSESALTLPGTTLGSVHYFSPEQARGELATPASDIYSLGIVLFELLTGKRPWTGDTAAAIATARLTGRRPEPRCRPRRDPAQPRCHRPQGPGDQPGGPLRDRERDGRRARAVPRRGGRGATAREPRGPRRPVPRPAGRLPPVPPARWPAPPAARSARACRSGAHACRRRATEPGGPDRRIPPTRTPNRPATPPAARAVGAHRRPGRGRARSRLRRSLAVDLGGPRDRDPGARGLRVREAHLRPRPLGGAAGPGTEPRRA